MTKNIKNNLIGKPFITQIGAIASLLWAITAQAGVTTESATATRAEVANPNNFERLHINGRAVSAASEPCLVSEGLLACTVKHTKIATGGFTSLDSDYHLVQSFIFNKHHKTKHPTAVVLLTKTGLQDDSIKAERLRISFELKYEHPNVGTWHWVQYGTQVQCARGKKAGTWVKRGCH